MTSTSTWILNPDVWNYIRTLGLRDDPVLAALREETRQMRFGHMQVAPEQGQLLKFLVSLLGARKILEVGVFTGYSSLCMARALPKDGRITALDNQPEFTGIAENYWRRADVSDRIQLEHGDALTLIRAMTEREDPPSYDLIFIDADKERYPEYYELCLGLLAPGGLLIFDNVLWYGNVVDPSHQEGATLAIRKLNNIIQSDCRVDFVMLPIADGMTLVRHAGLV